MAGSDGEPVRRPSPEEMLARAQREERRATRGRLRIFLGFAAGVGKTYEMLNEAHRRKDRGEDVVVGYVETHGRAGTEAQIGSLEIIPRRSIEYRGSVFEEMDTDAILARAPQLALVDELAHTNVPGSAREKRWQDVEVLLAAGINVNTTMNVQHLESLNDTVRDITGIHVRETVPDTLLRDADEIKMLDITPRSLINRMNRGDVYPPAKAQEALRGFFREGNLNALREIALREVAHEVDDDLATYRKEKNVRGVWATHDRVMVCISPDQSSLRLIRRAWRIAQRLGADAVAVYVENRPPTQAQRDILTADFALADRLGLPVVTLHGDAASELIRYAREHEVTQMVVGNRPHTRWQELLRSSVLARLARELRSVDILVVGTPPGE